MDYIPKTLQVLLVEDNEGDVRLIKEAFSESNPVPSDFKTLEELWEWHKPLIEVEKEWKEKNKEL